VGNIHAIVNFISSVAELTFVRTSVLCDSPGAEKDWFMAYTNQRFMIFVYPLLSLSFRNQTIW
jgi:hypothetical protein